MQKHNNVSVTCPLLINGLLKAFEICIYDIFMGIFKVKLSHNNIMQHFFGS
jgi:hypothetical protein